MEKYKLITQNLMNEEGKSYTTYGIKLTCGKNIRTFNDISTDKASIEKLIHKFNTYNLSQLHIEDAIENFLYDFVAD